MQQTTIRNIIALDVGDKRVGVAATNTLARLPGPLIVLKRGESFWQDLTNLIGQEKADIIVVGLPRNLAGNDTTQTDLTNEFIEELRKHTDKIIEIQDEALTSKKAESELNKRGKKFTKGDIDALAATYILEDYLNSRNIK